LTTEDYEFMSYVSTYGHNYQTTEEYKMRAAIWKEKDDFIKNYNAGGAAGHHHRHHARMRHNKYSHNTKAEWKKMRGWNKALRGVGPVTPTNLSPTLYAVPVANEVDWRTTNKVTPI
jgi:hypothetical protein